MDKTIPLVVANEFLDNIIFIVCKFLTAILSTVTFYFTLQIGDESRSTVVLLNFMIFVLSYDMANSLLTAYEVAAETLLVCTVEDYKYNRDSGVEKAYFESQLLNDYLVKKQYIKF